MILTYRYKLMPSKAQYRALDGILEQQRQLYNAALQERVEAWRKAKVSVSKIDQNKSLTEIRSFDEAYRALPVAMSRWAIARVDDAMKGFFGRVKRGDRAGFPRFKPMRRWRSFGFDEFKGIRLRDDRLLFSPLQAGLKLNLHRPLPDGASVKSCTFTREGRFWWVAMAVDVPVAEAHCLPDSVVGLDMGVTHLVTTSDGVHVPNVRPRTRREKELRRSQRALARCARHSRGRAKAREKMARLKRAVRNARTTYLHQVSADLAARYALIAVEALKVKNMTSSAKGTAEAPGTNVRQKAGLNRAMLDASPARLIDYLVYKAERAGGTVVKVDPRDTSQLCSCCKAKVEKTLSERVHRCEGCGTVLDRDVNAAINILDRALRHGGRAMPPGGANVGHWPVRRPGNAVSKAA